MFLFMQKEEFNDCKMEQIKNGLKEDLDVSIYAKPEIGFLTMIDIRRDMRLGIQSRFYHEGV